MIFITIISIIAIALVILFLNKIMNWNICPICAGVSGTWIWLLSANFMGYAIEMIVPAMLMGGTVVGIAYQIEKKLKERSMSQRIILCFKIIFISDGFIAVYSLLSQLWISFFTSFIFLSLIIFIFFLPQKSNEKNKVVMDLENKMKDCC